MINPADVLDKLAPNTWEGKGFNLIAVPNSEAEFGFELILNPTKETLKFTEPTGALDRGGMGHNVSLKAASYRQTILDPGRKIQIHEEPGMWAHLKPSDQSATEKNPPDTFFRLAVTPHGDCILAQSIPPFAPVAVDPVIKPANTHPFAAIPPGLSTDPANVIDESYLRQYRNPTADFPAEYLPEGKTLAEIVEDPTHFLRAAIKGQSFIETAEIRLSTKRTKPGELAGVLNIPFVTQNANAVQLDAIIWLENVEGAGSDQSFWQLQYVQRVILDFPVNGEGIHWPHVSVATLKLQDKQVGAQLS